MIYFQDDIEAVKKDWELNRLKALKEEEEKRAELEEDEMLYTYSRDDAYQQVKKRNRQLAQEARRVVSETQTVLSPRKAAAQGGAAVEVPKKKQWVYKTPKIIKDLVKNRNAPEGSVEDDKNRRKSKVKIRIDDDSNEDIDVETVDSVIEMSPGKTTKVKRKLDKPIIKRPRKSKGDSPIKAPRAGMVSAACSTEATKLNSLPGFTIQNPRENIFDQLHSPSKGNASRANIFEQFGVQAPPASFAGLNVVQAPNQAQVFQNALAGGTVRLINTPQGQKMVVVSSSSLQNPQTNPQNVVLLQGMQGFPQGIVVGSNIVSLQGTPLNVTPVGRAGTPVSIQTPRLVGSPQIVSPKYGARIVTPMGVQQNPALVQRFVTGQRVNANVLQGQAVQAAQLNQTNSQGLVNVSSLQQLTNIPQLRLNTPLVHTSGGQLVSLQQTPTGTQRKSSVQTIASLIAAGKANRPTQPVVHQQLNPPFQSQLSKPNPPINLTNLANLMRAQIPATIGSPVQTQSQVRVNPTVAKLVASHIHSVSSNASQTASSQAITSTRAASPAVMNLSTTTNRSQSPTVVKVVSVSRTASPTVTAASTIKQSVGAVHRGENPVATINIKGLPPGVSIPASLVNSLVSGSIGGMSKGTLRGVVPQANVVTTGARKTIVRLAQPTETYVNSNATLAQVRQVQNSTGMYDISTGSPKSAGRGITPVTASASPPTMQAWSNPNLVIRTRRAAIKSPVSLPRNPQSGPTPVSPAPITIDTVGIPRANGPTVVLANHVAKNIPQTAIPQVVQEVVKSDDNGNNEGVSIIEIT